MKPTLTITKKVIQEAQVIPEISEEVVTITMSREAAIELQSLFHNVSTRYDSDTSRLYNVWEKNPLSGHPQLKEQTK